jgi:hypothetical protein
VIEKNKIKPEQHSNFLFDCSFNFRPKVHKKRTFLKNHYLCMRVHLIRRASLEEYGLGINLASSRCTYMFVGLAHMQNMIKSAQWVINMI